MSWLGDLFSKGAGDAIGGTLEGAGEFAKDMRSAITGDIDPDKKAELIAKTFEIGGDIKKAQANVIMAEVNGS